MGFFRAARKALPATERRATARTAPPASMNVRGLIGARKAKFFSQARASRNAGGEADAAASITRTATSRERRPARLAVEAPKVFRIPISRIRRSAAKETRP